MLKSNRFGNGKNITKGMWNLDGNSKDSSGNGYHGVDTSVTYLNDNKLGRMAKFSKASNSRIAIGNLGSMEVATIVCWINSANHQENYDNSIIGSTTWNSNGDFVLELEGRDAGSPSPFYNLPLFYVYGMSPDPSTSSAYNSSKNLGDNITHCLIITYDTKNKSVGYYIDGVLDKIVTYTTTPNIDMSDVLIGSWMPGSYRSYDDYLGRLFIENYIWSSKEISNYYNQNKNKFKYIYYSSIFKKFLAMFTGQTFTQTCEDSLSLSDTLIKQPAKVLLNSITTLDSIIRSKTMSLVDSISSNDTISMIMSKFREFTETITTNDSFIARITALVITETIAITDSITKGLVAFKEFVEQVVVADTIAVLKVFVKNISESVSVVESFVKSFVKVITENISITEFIQKMRDVVYTESVAIVDSMTSFKVRIVSFIENISVLDSIIKRLNGFLSRWTRGRRASSDWTRKPKGD